MITQIVETNICGLDVTVTPNNIHIEDSYYITFRGLMEVFFEKLRKYMDDSHVTMDNPLKHRSDRSLCNEWISHNNAYKLAFRKEQSKDVDLNYPQPWYAPIVYWFCSLIVL